MSGIYLFNLTSRHNQWLSTRQTTIAANIANVNTPGYKTQDVKAFSAVLESQGLAMKATSPSHMSTAVSPGEVVETSEGQAPEILHSGNSVNLEQEMMKASDINRTYALNTSVLKSFQRMLLASAKG
jgi:flagellar basal-body rod protein FlgB